MSENNGPGFETLAIHAGARPDPTTGARQTPIYQTASFVFEDAEHAASLFNLQKLGFIYSRLTNPTVSVLEERIASLEGGVGAIAAASGHGAQLLALFPFMEPGAEIVAANKLYGGSINQLGNSFKRAFGWVTHFVDADDPENIRRAANDKTRAIFIESLANPGGVVSDIEAIARVARDLGVPLIVDNTMATPYLCRPIEHGADIVVHSTTKFLSGNGTSIGGVVVDSGRFNWAQSDKFKGLTGEEPG
jgi:O-acetylhomoserine (thiol)-lyase